MIDQMNFVWEKQVAEDCYQNAKVAKANVFSILLLGVSTIVIVGTVVAFLSLTGPVLVLPSVEMDADPLDVSESSTGEPRWILIINTENPNNNR